MIRIGTRGSALALWQAHHVRDRLAALGQQTQLVTITTTGDRLLDRRLELVGGKGAFLKEIEEAMLAGEVDLAVHSLKDVPTTLPDGLRLTGFLERADPRDALLSTSGAGLDALPQGARVGTTSLRRQAQLRALRPDLEVVDLRGNVDTRIRRLRSGDFDAILLAMAGLTRLGRGDEAAEVLAADRFLPAPGQGVVALECRAEDSVTQEAVAPLEHAATTRTVTAERAFLAALGGGCNVPLGAHATLREHSVVLDALVARADGSEVIRDVREDVDPEALGRHLAETLLARGAAALLA